MQFSKMLFCTFVLSVCLITLSASAEEDKSISEVPLYYVCSEQNNNLQSWIDKTSAIFVGTVIDVQAKLPGRPYQDNACWVKFKVTEWLKSKGPNEIWVRNVIDSYNNSYEDFESLRYCDYQKGQKHLIFGDYTKKSLLEIVPDGWVSTATTKGLKLTPLNCPPNTEVNDDYDNYPIVERTKTYLKESAAHE